MCPCCVSTTGTNMRAHTHACHGQVSEGARQLQPASSTWFVAETGDIKIMKGIRKFHTAEVVNVEDLAPRIDSPSFSMMAWVRLKEGKGSNILRKPLGQVPDEFKLSCWGWCVLCSHKGSRV